ncbi:MAG: hypothetical protein GDA49_04135 [Rhodospirillales bacterium]|nr:hypothetical protein [Rhodospirillales bacterium]
MPDEIHETTGDENKGLTSEKHALVTIPVERLPSFVDDEWISKYIYLERRYLNVARMDTDLIANLTGYEGWPTDKKALGEVGCSKALPYFLDALRYPAFLRVFYLLSVKKFNLGNKDPCKRPSKKDFQYKVVDPICKLTREYWPDREPSGEDKDKDKDTGEFVNHVLESCFEHNDPDTALTFMFHMILFPMMMSMFPTSRFDWSSIVGILEARRNEIESPDDIDIIIEFGERLQLIDGAVYDSTWKEAIFSSTRKVSEDVADAGNEAAEEDVVQVTTEADDIESDITMDEDATTNATETPPQKAEIVDRWRTGVAAVQAAVEEMEMPNRQGVEGLRALVAELEDLVDLYDSVPEAVPLIEIKERLSTCHCKLVKMGAKWVTAEESALSRRIDGVPDEVAATIPLEDIENRVNGTERATAEVKEIKQERKRVRQIEDDDELEAATAEIGERFRKALRLAFKSIEDVLLILDSVTSFASAEASSDNDRDVEVYTDEEFDASLAEVMPSEPALAQETDDTPEAGTYPADDGIDVVEEEVEVEADEAALEIDDINGRLDELFAEKEFGAAYHLALAAEAKYPEARLAFTSAELFLVTCANHTQVTSYADVDQYAEALRRALVAANELSSSEGEQDQDKARTAA